MVQKRRKARLMGIALSGAVLLAACGGGDGAETTEPLETPTTTAGQTADDGSVFVIEATDYAFANLPDTLPVGTELKFINRSSVEAHEAVVVRIPDDEDRTIAELLELEEEEADALFEAGFKGVLVAMPEEEGFAPEGPVTLDEAGRYAIVCFFPIGHDPQELAEAMSDPEAEGPPDLGGGPPHFTAGMMAELTVEG